MSVKDWDGAVAPYASAFRAIELFAPRWGGLARMSVGGAEFWVAEASPEHLNFSPERLGGCSVRLLLIVDVPAGLCQRAIAAGATLVVADAYGWRLGRILDPFGHHWEIGRPVP